ncbi:hypothetical protein E4U57_001286 [Claviceps arundinis]|uniref:Uncharacterized protein n=1 Tax=Claviceps arundinis TaxID=1623583 RepID=A0ABQ7PAX8_9HYPO|nr:hypothetical protein E4U57_001286 [Claviceps arundinis]
MSTPSLKEKESKSSETEAVVGPWAPRMVDELRCENPKAAALSSPIHNISTVDMLSGAAHENRKTGDPYHATARLTIDQGWVQ